MQTLIAWCGLVGAWLLFAGPLYQAALELRAHEIARDRSYFAATVSAVPKPPRISYWWWLVPPIRMVLERRRSSRYRKALLAALSAKDHEALLTFFDKATGWMLVAFGALLLATKETLGFVHSPVAGLLVAAGLSALSALMVALRIGTTERQLRARSLDSDVSGKSRASR